MADGRTGLLGLLPSISSLLPPVVVALVIIWCGVQVYDHLAKFFDDADSISEIGDGGVADGRKRRGNPFEDDGAAIDRPLRPNNVHFPCSFYAHRGVRDYMEDRYAFEGCINGRRDMSYYACFDGHGGSLASQYAADQLHVHLSGMKDLGEAPREALREAFLKTDREFLKAVQGTGRTDGTTAVVALVVANRIYVANAGDSRAVLVQRGARSVALSQDHKPCDPSEKKRITDLGGKIVFWGRWRVEGVLAVSRAIGDQHLKRYVPSEPEVQEWALKDDDHFLVLATDGLWDVLSNEMVAQIVVNTSHNFKSTAQQLCEEAWRSGSTDNVSAVVVDLRGRPATVSSDQANDPPLAGQPAVAPPVTDTTDTAGQADGGGDAS